MSSEICATREIHADDMMKFGVLRKSHQKKRRRSSLKEAVRHRTVPHATTHATIMQVHRCGSAATVHCDAGTTWGSEFQHISAVQYSARQEHLLLALTCLFAPSTLRLHDTLTPSSLSLYDGILCY